MKAIWKWLGTPAAFRIVSAVFFLYLCLPALAPTRSWWDTFNSVLVFAGIWGLGFYSAPEKDQP
jgi:hypothetical protein